ncbi:hypothetical protein BU15DRAFT_64765 [Melanogaster broomeanus]|nr:hypothetical protein BU15DRAFT_64765 [Melanogaster broomeanus]
MDMSIQPTSTGSASVPTSTVTLSFPPITLPSDVHRATSDPCGFLPWLCRLRHEATENQRVLSFSNVTKSLNLWFWPVLETGGRVTPDALLTHRQTHRFLGPGCLCSSQSIDGTFTEALIFQVELGRFSGQWVAACAARVCKYWVFIERLYPKHGLPIKIYPKREPGESVPGPVRPVYGDVDYAGPPTQPNTPNTSPFTPRLAGFHGSVSQEPSFVANLSENSSDPATPTPTAGSSNALPTHATIRLGKRKRANTDLDPFLVLPGPKRLEPVRISDFTLLLKMDSFAEPGLTAAQLKKILWHCDCGLMMTKRVYEIHECLMVEKEVIDLTGEDSD